MTKSVVKSGSDQNGASLSGFFSTECAEIMSKSVIIPDAKYNTSSTNITRFLSTQKGEEKAYPSAGAFR